MITRLYACAEQGEFEHQQRMSDPPLRECPRCGDCVPKRLIASATNDVVLVSGDSGGWASSGYAKPENVRRAEVKLGRKTLRPV